MANVAVQRVEEKTSKPLPLLREIEKQYDDVRRRAFDLFEKRGRELGHALEDWLKAEHEVTGWPAAELTEAESNYELAMTLPGYDPKDIQVTVTPSEIIVHANVETGKKAEKGKCVWTEFRSNEVYRRFGLPGAIDVDKTTAKLDKGMLHVTARKTAKSQAKPIAVGAA